MNDNEQRVKELEAQLAAKDKGFDFGRAMARIKAKQQDNDLYRQQMEAAFEQGLAEPTKYI